MSSLGRSGYQYLRDYDSQPGVDPKFPRTYEQDKVFAKLTWQLKPGLQLLQSFHQEFWVNPAPPTIVATDNLFSSTFGQPTVFMNPRRVMVSARLNVGR